MTIYVLRADNLVKIGFTEDLRKRVQNIIWAIPFPVEFVGHMPGGRDVERHFHDRFKSRHFSGEWFVETPEMRTVFEALLTPRIPTAETERDPKRVASDDDTRIASEQIREIVINRWPHLGKVKRIAALAQELGWNTNRVRDLYYGDKRSVVRAFERDELNRLLAQESAQ